MKRQIIRIIDEKCTGCGLCVTGCPEGALQVVDGKARLVGEILCDGLGACIGTCPEEAIIVEEREAEPYDERKVMDNILAEGPNVLRAHLEHLIHHDQVAYLATARQVMKEKGIEDPTAADAAPVRRPVHGFGLGHGGGGGGGCPGSRAFSFDAPAAPEAPATAAAPAPSRLTHWPVQMHLLSPMAPQYQGADLLLAADCAAFALGDFHERFLKDRTLAIACPKLDEGKDVYVDKLVGMIDQAKVKSITVVMMEVPCCGGLMALVQQAQARAQRDVPIHQAVVGVRGGVLSER
jgi:NAD-dependent dihydropyrimidine dehydrogenase PreA subunit